MIAAVGSPPGPGERGVLRLSGANLVECVLACFVEEERAQLARFLDAGRGRFEGRFQDGVGAQPVSLLWMPGPHSYTREDVAEFHLPGAPALLAAALERVLELGARAAAPGEFTRRAFLNGRLDLSQAEGVLEVVSATSEAEHRAGLALLAGGLRERLEGLRDGLDDLRALCEASLDFDESDTGHVPVEELLERGEACRAGLEEALGWELRREAALDAPRVVLVGAPNAGKSSLFNALADGREALVSDLAGSTRDGVRGWWRLAGGDVWLSDAAGVDAGASGADARAQQLAAAEREGADLLLWVVDATRPAAGERPAPLETPCLRLWNKVDLEGAAEPPADAPGLPTLAVSARSGLGLEPLAERASRLLWLGATGPDEELRAGAAGPGLARELFARHRRALADARDELAATLGLLEAGAPLDAAAQGLREATAALDQIRGETTPEDLLDRIFSRFCIGK